MRYICALLFIAVTAGCGAETATTAAAGAAIKKQELEEGKKTMARTQEKIGQAMEQANQRAEKGGEP